MAVFILLPQLAKKTEKKVESLYFGAIPSISEGLIYVAQEMGFFTQNGLIINIRNYPSGVATINALRNEEVDIADAAELQLVSSAFAGERISVFAVINRFTHMYLLGLRNHGIQDISGIKAKKIGVVRHTIAEFYLARFLKLQNFNPGDVVIVDVPPVGLVEALSNGTVDAVVAWEPITRQIRTRFKDEIIAWSVHSNQPGYGMIIARNSWLEAQPAIAARFLKSLVEAESYLVQHPVAARKVIQEAVGYSGDAMEMFWSENQLTLSLDNSLVISMEDEARWLINNHLTPEKSIPNFLNYIYVDALKAVKPEAMTLMR